MTGVWAANVAPTAVASASPNPVTTSLDVITLTGTASTDPAPGTLRSYLWEYVSGDRTGAFADTAAGQTTFTPAPDPVSDTFNRADSATTMGTTVVGAKTWTPNSNTWGISSNQAYLASATGSGNQATTVVTTDWANVKVKGTYAAAGDSGVCVRSVDDANNFFTSTVTSGSEFWTRVGGGFTSLATFAALAAGDIVEVEMNGTTFTVRVNNVQVATGTNSARTTATKHGLRINVTSARWDDWSATGV